MLEYMCLIKMLVSHSECGELTVPRYGSVAAKIGEDGLSEIATFSCAPGYYVSGSSALHCENGAWDDREPECKREHLHAQMYSVDAIQHGCSVHCMYLYINYSYSPYTDRACIFFFICTFIFTHSCGLWRTRGSTQWYCGIRRHSLHGSCPIQV